MFACKFIADSDDEENAERDALFFEQEFVTVYLDHVSSPGEVRL